MSFYCDESSLDLDEEFTDKSKSVSTAPSTLSVETTGFSAFHSASTRKRQAESDLFPANKKRLALFETGESVILADEEIPSADEVPLVVGVPQADKDSVFADANAAQIEERASTAVETPAPANKFIAPAEKASSPTDAGPERELLNSDRSDVNILEDEDDDDDDDVEILSTNPPRALKAPAFRNRAPSDASDVSCDIDLNKLERSHNSIVVNMLKAAGGGGDNAVDVRTPGFVALGNVLKNGAGGELRIAGTDRALRVLPAKGGPYAASGVEAKKTIDQENDWRVFDEDGFHPTRLTFVCGFCYQTRNEERKSTDPFDFEFFSPVKLWNHQLLKHGHRLPLKKVMELCDRIQRWDPSAKRVLDPIESAARRAKLEGKTKTIASKFPKVTPTTMTTKTMTSKGAKKKSEEDPDYLPDRLPNEQGRLVAARHSKPVPSSISPFPGRVETMKRNDPYDSSVTNVDVVVTHGIFKCIYCRKLFKDEPRLFQHQTTEHCPYCGKLSSLFRGLECKHLQSHDLANDELAFQRMLKSTPHSKRSAFTVFVEKRRVRTIESAAKGIMKVVSSLPIESTPSPSQPSSSISSPGKDFWIEILGVDPLAQVKEKNPVPSPSLLCLKCVVDPESTFKRPTRLYSLQTHFRIKHRDVHREFLKDYKRMKPKISRRIFDEFTDVLSKYQNSQEKVNQACSSIEKLMETWTSTEESRKEKQKKLRRSNFRESKVWNGDKNPISCQLCQSPSFPSAISLFRHLLFHHSSLYFCHLCFALLSSSSALERHLLRSHSTSSSSNAEDRWFSSFFVVDGLESCVVCRLSFLSRKHLCDHLETSHPVRGARPVGRPRRLPPPDPVDDGAEETVKEPGVETATLEKWRREYAAARIDAATAGCRLCHNRSGALALSGVTAHAFHLLYHHARDPRLIRCPFCGAAMPDERSAMLHRRLRHWRDFPSRCTICPESFIRAAQLEEHVKDQHRGKLIARRRATPVAEEAPPVVESVDDQSDGSGGDIQPVVELEEIDGMSFEDHGNRDAEEGVEVKPEVEAIDVEIVEDNRKQSVKSDQDDDDDDDNDESKTSARGGQIEKLDLAKNQKLGGSDAEIPDASVNPKPVDTADSSAPSHEITVPASSLSEFPLMAPNGDVFVISCPLCKVLLGSRDQLLAHLGEVHAAVLRPAIPSAPSLKLEADIFKARQMRSQPRSVASLPRLRKSIDALKVNLLPSFLDLKSRLKAAVAEAIVEAGRAEKAVRGRRSQTDSPSFSWSSRVVDVFDSLVDVHLTDFARELPRPERGDAAAWKRLRGFLRDEVLPLWPEGTMDEWTLMRACRVRMEKFLRDNYAVSDGHK